MHLQWIVSNACNMYAKRRAQGRRKISRVLSLGVLGYSFICNFLKKFIIKSSVWKQRPSELRLSHYNLSLPLGNSSTQFSPYSLYSTKYIVQGPDGSIYPFLLSLIKSVPLSSMDSKKYLLNTQSEQGISVSTGEAGLSR